jgi:hypothetical protein
MDLIEAKQVLNDNGYILTETLEYNKKLIYKPKGGYAKFGKFITELVQKKGKVLIADALLAGVFAGKVSNSDISWALEGYNALVANPELQKYADDSFDKRTLDTVRHKLFEKNRCEARGIEIISFIRYVYDKSCKDIHFDGSVKDFIKFYKLYNKNLDGHQGLFNYIQACQVLEMNEPEYKVTKTKPINQSTIEYVG